MQSFHSTSQSFIGESSDFADIVADFFVGNNIPLYKLRSDASKRFFQRLNKPTPSETTCRQRIEGMAEKQFLRIKELVGQKEIFVAVDEADVGGQRYVNFLVGVLEEPHVMYMFDCRHIPAAANAQIILHTVDDCIRQLEVDRANFCLLLSDAAPYMVLAGSTMKQFYPRLFHVTCVAHLLHNCAVRVKNVFGDVNSLISRIKNAVVKNQSRKDAFSDIGQPPLPIITRWCSWLLAARFYAENLPEVKRIVLQFTGEGLLVQAAKTIVQKAGLYADLRDIHASYDQLIKIVTRMESSTATIREAHQQLRDLQFGADRANIRPYLEKRLRSNDLTAICEMTREEISPALYCMLQAAQPSTAEVERSFSLLNKILVDDRNFLPSSVKHYMCVYFNTSRLR